MTYHANKKNRSIPESRIMILMIFLLCSFTRNSSSGIVARERTSNDTLPGKEVASLKRADIYFVDTYPDSVNIRLKSRESILMSRKDFDALPFDVKKELSANNDGVFRNEQTEPDYPGGQRAWLNYLNRMLNYPEDAVRSRVEGTVVLQFIVDEKGVVSDVQAIAGPIGSLREEAIRVIKRSGKWNPATLNGYKVRAYKKQPLTFKLNP